KGLITRTRGEQDRREVYVQLTARGEHLLDELTVHTRAELRSAAPRLVATLRHLTSQKNTDRLARRPKTAIAGRSK
ncbi:MAG: hypothetical protein WCC25_09270, partial [Candidatus Korobacteraceae bacterium]